MGAKHKNILAADAVADADAAAAAAAAGDLQLDLGLERRDAPRDALLLWLLVCCSLLLLRSRA